MEFPNSKWNNRHLGSCFLLELRSTSIIKVFICNEIFCSSKGNLAHLLFRMIQINFITITILFIYCRKLTLGLKSLINDEISIKICYGVHALLPELVKYLL